MNTDVVSVAAYFALWGAFCGAILWVANTVEATASSSMRSELVAWLHREPASTRSINRLPAMYIAAFDRFFGDKPLSWKYLHRSVAVTAVVTTMVFLAWVTGRADDAIEAAQKVLLLNPSALSVVLAALGWIAGAAIVSALPDYLSLMKSRALIGAAVRANSAGRMIGLLATDVVLSAVLGFLAVILFSVATFLFVHNQIKLTMVISSINTDRVTESSSSFDFKPFPLQRVWDTLTLKKDTTLEMKSSFHTIDLKNIKGPATIDLNKGDPRSTTVWKGALGSFVPVGVNFYATFFSIIWMAMFVAATAWVRMYPSVVAVARRFRWAFNVTEKPFHSLGVMIVVWVSAAFAAGLVLSIPFRI